ncbi:sugar ABC transporter ATP-binding protein [Helicobacter apodemus]|uniref:Sugar ABC transporter ATP-binding protein n=1 Tax=Helicobacter apodemus TaxID=135569 RepID=A0A4U8UGL6_9HELI|nr:ATP-binding cassette domain-containing protein [Helicobacter apodemus]TLE16548.1 sugar ABC transporter ATP-binding protein [Helicobacter apodemus]
MSAPIIHIENITKHFGNIIALNGISMDLYPGEVMCLLGDNGAGKSTLIKTLAGVHEKTSGIYKINGKDVIHPTPQKILDEGVATVYQDLSTIPLMSLTRNFFLGREDEILKKIPFLNILDFKKANKITIEAMQEIGINVREPSQPIGTLSGGERQCLAIAKAVHFGAKVLILDEPTSALGVAQSSMVLKYILQARKRNLGVIFITHNVFHAYAVGDRFTILNRGKTLGTFKKDEITTEELQNKMAGDKTIQDLTAELGEATKNL